MSLMEAEWDWLHLWPRHSCPLPVCPLALITHQSWRAAAKLPLWHCWAADGWQVPVMACVSRLMLSHIWARGTASGMDGRVRGQLR